MWTIRYPGTEDHPDAVWGWDKENDRPHFFDVMTRRTTNRQGVVTQYPIVLDRSDGKLRLELGYVLKHKPTDWWCFGFYGGFLRQPHPDDGLPLEERMAEWEDFQAHNLEKGAGFVTQRAAVTHMLYRTGWYSAPF